MTINQIIKNDTPQKTVPWILWSFHGPCNQSEVICSSSTAKWHLDEPRLSGLTTFQTSFPKSMKRVFQVPTPSIRANCGQLSCVPGQGFKNTRVHTNIIIFQNRIVATSNFFQEIHHFTGSLASVALNVSFLVFGGKARYIHLNKRCQWNPAINS